MWPYWPRNPRDRHSFNLRGYKLRLHCATMTRRTLAETYTITGTMKNISGRPLMTGTSHTSKRKPHRSCDLKIKDRSHSYLRNNASYGPQKVRHKNPAIAGGQRKEPIDHLVPQRNPTIIWREGRPHMLVWGFKAKESCPKPRARSPTIMEKEKHTSITTQRSYNMKVLTYARENFGPKPRARYPTIAQSEGEPSSARVKYES